MDTGYWSSGTEAWYKERINKLSKSFKTVGIRTATEWTHQTRLNSGRKKFLSIHRRVVQEFFEGKKFSDI